MPKISSRTGSGGGIITPLVRTGFLTNLQGVLSPENAKKNQFLIPQSQNQVSPSVDVKFWINCRDAVTRKCKKKRINS